MIDDVCTTFYLFGPHPMCLHKLFEQGYVQVLVQQQTRYKGKQFYIYRDKPPEKSKAWRYGWWRAGRASRLTDVEQVLLAIELADKYNVTKVRL